MQSDFSSVNAPAAQAAGGNSAHAPERRRRSRSVPSLLALYFDVPGLRLCLPLDRVMKTHALMALQEVPGAPDYLAGLLNLGGDIVPVVDLCRRLGRQAFPYNVDTPVLVCEAEGQRCGLIVERVEGVRALENGQRRMNTHVLAGDGPFLAVFGHRDDMVLMLDLDAIAADFRAAA